MSTGSSTLSRAPRPSSLADVLDLILDKGLVIDAYVRVSVVGIEILTIDARIVVASVDTYLHFAEAVNRLDLGQTETQGIAGLFDGKSVDDGANGKGDSSRSRSRRNGQPEIESDRSRPDGNGSGNRDDSPSRRRPQGVARRLADRAKWQEDE